MRAAVSRRPHLLAAWTAVAEVVGIGPGTAVLEVGCGAGGFCDVAAARGAEVHGLDIAPAAIECARRRVVGGDFHVGLMEELPWPDGSFDVVTGFNAFQYALDLDSALGEARRVSRPGGRLAICKWGRPQENEFFALLIALGVGRSASLQASDPIDDALRRMRLAIDHTGGVPVAMEMDDAAALEASLIAAGALQAPVGEADRGRLIDSGSPYRQLDGSYRFRSRLTYLIATT